MGWEITDLRWPSSSCWITRLHYNILFYIVLHSCLLHSSLHSAKVFTSCFLFIVPSSCVPIISPFHVSAASRKFWGFKRVPSSSMKPNSFYQLIYRPSCWCSWSYFGFKEQCWCTGQEQSKFLEDDFANCLCKMETVKAFWRGNQHRLYAFETIT